MFYLVITTDDTFDGLKHYTLGGSLTTLKQVTLGSTVSLAEVGNSSGKQMEVTIGSYSAMGVELVIDLPDKSINSIQILAVAPYEETSTITTRLLSNSQYTSEAGQDLWQLPVFQPL